MTIDEDLRGATAALRAGGLVVYPTDTIWGIGCDATDSDAVRRVFALKRRADSKALITLVADLAMLERYADGIPDVAYELLEAAVSPLTVIYDRGVGVAPELLAPDGSIAMRIPRDDYASRLCRMLRRPIVSTSANISGQPAPRCYADISPEVIAGADYVASHRRAESAGAATPSAIIKLTASGVVTVIR